MFGYITPLKRDLKVGEFEYFRSYYHGLCYSLKNNFGNIPRLTLSYDMTFIGFILDGLNNEPISFTNRRCIKHPTYEIIVTDETKPLRYAADLSITFFNYKLEDNIKDEDSTKSRIFSKFLAPYTRKAMSSYSNIISIIKTDFDKIALLEQKKSFCSLDEVCHPFSDIMGSILREYPYELNEDNTTLRNNLYNLGYSIGKYIYLMDAFDDLEDDIISDHFNPLCIIYNLNIKNYMQYFEELITEIDFDILSCISNCKDIIDNLNFIRHREIIDNIITLGMTNKFYEVSNKIYKKIPPKS